MAGIPRTACGSDTALSRSLVGDIHVYVRES